MFLCVCFYRLSESCREAKIWTTGHDIVSIEYCAAWWYYLTFSTKSFYQISTEYWQIDIVYWAVNRKAHQLVGLVETLCRSFHCYHTAIFVQVLNNCWLTRLTLSKLRFKFVTFVSENRIRAKPRNNYAKFRETSLLLKLSTFWLTKSMLGNFVSYVCHI